MVNKIHIVNRKEEYLPIKLIDRINTEIFYNNRYEYRTKNNFLLCIGIIYFKQMHDYHDLQCYVPTGAAYWKTIFGGDYHEKVIDPLLQMDILKRHDFGFRTYGNKLYCNSKGKEKGLVGIRYRINPSLTSDNNFSTITYINKGNSKLRNAEEYIIGAEFICNPVPNKDFYISIDRHKAYEWVDNNAESICTEYFKPNYINELNENLIIEYHLYIEGGTFETKYGTIKSAKQTADRLGKQLFFFKDAFYIADTNKFLKYRIEILKHHYKCEISKIGTLPIEDRRSPKTLRLYNHLVNFPSKILQFININNQTVVQLDLRTSQFLLFANLLNVYITKGEKGLLGLFKKKQTLTYLKRLISVLEKHQNLIPSSGVDLQNPSSFQYSNYDVIKFINDVFYKDFYTVVQKELSLPDRGLAKLVLFKLLFKKNNIPDAQLKKLANHYTVVMSIIAAFKQKDKTKLSNEQLMSENDNNFSVFLQCIESEIFIDNILIPLRSKGIPCFTRHDSIVVARGYEDEVERFTKDVFQRFEFKYNHKVDDLFWDVVDMEELENSGYLEWLSDENELLGDFYTDDNIEETNKERMENIETMDEQGLEILEKLMEIGEQNDYYDFLDIDLLENLTLLPLQMNERNILYEEINNLKDGMSFFQTETNELIHRLANQAQTIVSHANL